jgi:hypothetical protein
LVNQLARKLETAGFMEPIDALLADIAIRVQLSATHYGKAESRNQTISEYLDREGSPLQGLADLTVSAGVDGD